MLSTGSHTKCCKLDLYVLLSLFYCIIVFYKISLYTPVFSCICTVFQTIFHCTCMYLTIENFCFYNFLSSWVTSRGTLHLVYTSSELQGNKINTESRGQNVQNSIRRLSRREGGRARERGLKNSTRSLKWAFLQNGSSFEQEVYSGRRHTQLFHWIIDVLSYLYLQYPNLNIKLFLAWICLIML